MTAPGSNKTRLANLSAKGSFLLPGLCLTLFGSNSFPVFSIGNVLMGGTKGAQTPRIKNPGSSFIRMNVMIPVMTIKPGMSSNKLLILLEELVGLRTKC